MTLYRSGLSPLSFRHPPSFSRGAVPLFPAMTRRGPVLPSVTEAVLQGQPANPLYCLRPDVIESRARRFQSLFPGDVLYAVKCNPDPRVLTALWDSGLRHFDAASLTEVALVRGLLPEALIHFMHPVKARPHIRAAYGRHGVKDFVFDAESELTKILEETDHAQDLGLIVRLALPKGGALWDLSGKFGALPVEAARLLRLARPKAKRLGLCFHVGSQCMDPQSYDRALNLAAETLAEAGVAIDILDLGGGFPVSYPDITPPPLDAFMDVIHDGLERLGLPSGCQVWSEPGRALVAPAASLVVQVLMRRDDALYITDGIYGSLSDAGVPRFRFPTRLIRPIESEAPLAGFRFYGPTCDSADVMEGPFYLPADIREGDWIEIGQLGAYGACLKTAFNGLGEIDTLEVSDGPLLLTPGYNEDRAIRAA